MAPRWKTAILWTLISVNTLALIFGGLISWLGYAIPVRLRQFGLAPQLAQVAGFASLLIACLGLCALNYSSHYALNVYGLSCAAFAVILLFGTVPEEWNNEQRAAAAAHQHRQAQEAKSLSLNVSQLGNSSLYLNGTGASNASPTGVPNNSSRASDNVATRAGASGTGGILLDLIYFFLLTLLTTLLLFAFAMAQYLRRKEAEEGYADEGCSGAVCADEQDAAAEERDWQRALGSGAVAAHESPVCTCGAGGASLPAAAVNQLLYKQQQQQQQQFDNIEGQHQTTAANDFSLLARAGRQQQQAKSNNCRVGNSGANFCPSSLLAVPRQQPLAAPSNQFYHNQNSLATRLSGAGNNGSRLAASLRRRATHSSFLFNQKAAPHKCRQPRRISSYLSACDKRPADERRQSAMAPHNSSNNNKTTQHRAVADVQPLVHKAFYQASQSQENLNTRAGDERAHREADKRLIQLGALDLALGAAEQRDAQPNCDSSENVCEIGPNLKGQIAKSQANSIGSIATASLLAADKQNSEAPTCRCHLLADSSLLTIIPNAQNSNGSLARLRDDIGAAYLAGQMACPSQHYYSTMPSLNLSSIYAIKSNNAVNYRQLRRQQPIGREKLTGQGTVTAMTAAATAAFLGQLTGSSLVDSETVTGDVMSGTFDGLAESGYNDGCPGEHAADCADNMLAHDHQHQHPIDYHNFYEASALDTYGNIPC